MHKYTSRLVAAAGAVALVGGVGMAAASASVATPLAHATVTSVTPKTLSNGRDVITNNGVAGDYVNGSGPYKTLCQQITTSATSDNMVPVKDGIGGQMGNVTTGEVAGAGLERTGANLYGVFFGWGFLTGDPGAIFGNPPFFDADTNPLLGGILPVADVQHLTLTSPIRTSDTVQICEHQYSTVIKSRVRYRVAIQATDLTYGDTSSHVMALGTQDPWFNQEGVGSQRSLANLSSQALAANQLAVFTGVSSVPYWSGEFNDFGCPRDTTAVNSAANSNAGGGTEPNPFAQIDTHYASGGGLTGGCVTMFNPASDGATVTVFEGNPNS